MNKSPAYKAGVSWLKKKVKTAKRYFLITPGAEQYLKKMGMEGTRDIPKNSPQLMHTPFVRARVDKANEMYQDFLNGANVAWEEHCNSQRKNGGED